MKKENLLLKERAQKAHGLEEVHALQLRWSSSLQGSPSLRSLMDTGIRGQGWTTQGNCAFWCLVNSLDKIKIKKVSKFFTSFLGSNLKNVLYRPLH